LQNLIDSMNNDNEEASGEEASGRDLIQTIFEQKSHHLGSIYCLDWSSSGRLIASGSNDKTIKLMVCPNFEEGDNNEILEMSLVGHQATVRTICFNPINNLHLLSGGIIDTDIKVWDTETGKNFMSLIGHTGAIYSIKIANEGALCASVGTDKNLRVWDLRINQPAFSINSSKYSEMNDLSFNIDLQKHGFNVVKNGRNEAAVAHSGGEITLWDLGTRKIINEYGNHFQEARSVSFNFDGKYLASGAFDGLIKIMDVSNGKIVKTMTHNDRVVNTKWHPFLPILVSTSADKTTRVWAPS